MKPESSHASSPRTPKSTSPRPIAPSAKLVAPKAVAPSAKLAASKPADVAAARLARPAVDAAPAPKALVRTNLRTLKLVGAGAALSLGGLALAILARSEATGDAHSPTGVVATARSRAKSTALAPATKASLPRALAAAAPQAGTSPRAGSHGAANATANQGLVRHGAAPVSVSAAQEEDEGEDDDEHDEPTENGDPRPVAVLLERLRSTNDQGELELVTATLAQKGGKAAEALAVQLAAHDPSPARRIAAFDLLDALDTPAAVDVALGAIERDRDARIRQAAIQSLPPSNGASELDAQRIVGVLARVVTGDEDPEARRRAAVLLGDWGRRGDLEPVLVAFTRDPAPTVRAGAAFAFEMARATDPKVRSALLAAMDRPGEDDLVRENAWHALGAAGPLPAAEHARWARFRDERAAREAARNE